MSAQSIDDASLVPSTTEAVQVMAPTQNTITNGNHGIQMTEASAKDTEQDTASGHHAFNQQEQANEEDDDQDYFVSNESKTYSIFFFSSIRYRLLILGKFVH